MGITVVQARLANPYRRDEVTLDVELIVDTGAVYSVVPDDLLAPLGILPLGRETFALADGTQRTYPVGEAFFEVAGRRATSKVVFGPVAATPLLGALTLESLGLMVDPATRTLVPGRLVLAGLSALTAGVRSRGYFVRHPVAALPSNRSNVTERSRSSVALGGGAASGSRSCSTCATAGDVCRVAGRDRTARSGADGIGAASCTAASTTSNG